MTVYLPPLIKKYIFIYKYIFLREGGVDIWGSGKYNYFTTFL